MNRAERRRLQKQGKKAEKDRVLTIKESEMRNMILSPNVREMINQEVHKKILEIDTSYTLDLDTMVLWTLYQYGWREKRLKRFYYDMFRWHRKLRAHYEMSETFPERKMLKEKGIDVEAWFNELFDDEGNYRMPLEEMCDGL